MAWTRRTGLYALAVATCALAAARGAGASPSELEFLEAEPFPTWVGAYEAVVSPDGGHVYVAGTNELGLGASGVAVYARDAASGLLELVQVLHTWNGAHSLVIAPDGAHVYVLIGGYDIETLARDPVTGMLSLVSSVDGPPISRNDLLAISPDGRHVYGVGANVVVWYDRDPATGALAFAGHLVDPVAGTEGEGPELAGANAVAISPDGRSVYVAAWEDDALTVLARDEATGALTFVQALVQGEAGVDGLGEPTNVEVSPDGRNVYASGARDDVASFARDADDGTLTFLGVTAGSGGNASETAIAISADGRRLYLPGVDAAPCCRDVLSVFARDTGTGELTLLETVREEQGPTSNGLGFPSSAVVSPDGLDLYVSARDSAAVAAFRIVPLCAPEPRASCHAAANAAASSLVVHDRPGSRRDALEWQWRRGEVAREELGDPRADTDFVFCVYAADGAAWQRVAEIPVPPAGTCGGKPCWRPLGGEAASRGFVYRDPRGEHGGLRELGLRVGAAGGRILVRTKGDGVNVPNLPLDADRLVAQLATSDGACWQSTFSAPGLQSDARIFRDRGD